MTFLTKSFLTVVLCLIGAGFCNTQVRAQPLKVFILVGQSNMQGHADVRTLPHIGMDPKTKPILNELVDEQGNPRIIDDVWISYLSSNGVKTGKLTTGFGANASKIGPELTFGIYMQKKLDEPILIIKTAWGGKSINTDFRSPSAGPYPFAEATLERLKKQGKDLAKIKADKNKATGFYYRQTIQHVKSVLADIKTVYPKYDASRGYELAGMVWFQGWNDMVDSGTYPNRGSAGGYDAYSKVLAHMIRDFRKDLGAPKLPFVIGVMGAGGPTNKYTKQQQRYKKIHQSFRDAMAAPAGMDEFKGNVVTVLTENFWDMELDGLLTRQSEIRNKVKRAKKKGVLLELATELNQGQKLTDEELQTFKTLKKSNKLEQAISKSLQTREFTVREMQILELGRSNAAYHYLGCGKIMAQIGKGFADALSAKLVK